MCALTLISFGFLGLSMCETDGGTGNKRAASSQDAAKHFWSDTETKHMLDEIKDLNIFHLLDDICSYFQVNWRIV